MFVVTNIVNPGLLASLSPENIAMRPIHFRQALSDLRVFSEVLRYCLSLFREYEGRSFILALGFCKEHCRTDPYFIHFNRLICSPLTETQFPVLKSRL